MGLKGKFDTTSELSRLWDKSEISTDEIPVVNFEEPLLEADEAETQEAVVITSNSNESGFGGNANRLFSTQSA